MSVSSGPVASSQATTATESPFKLQHDHRFQRVALTLVRLDLGFLFLWAFLDKVFGLGYSTSPKHDWLNGGSPTNGYLSGVNVGPLQGLYHAIAGLAVTDWLFMLGLLGIGLTMLLGIGMRVGAVAGILQTLFMWLSVWPPATMGGGQPTGSTNPLIDEHILEMFGFLVLMSCLSRANGPLGRWWQELSFVKKHPWLQ